MNDKWLPLHYNLWIFLDSSLGESTWPLTKRESFEYSTGSVNKDTKVSNWRRRTKQKLLDAHGGKCVDCGFQGKPWQMDFDHRDPEIKEFGISAGGVTRSYEKQLAESMKCDLVCANCHRNRTHKQRCIGCLDCE